MVSKFLSDYISSDGIYTAWIRLHDYPFLPTAEFQDSGEVAADCMVPLNEIICVEGTKLSLRDLGQ